MLIYVGCADDSQYDQVLEEFIVPPLNKKEKGKQMLDLSVSPPDPKKIPSKEDILSPTVLMITVFYRRQEFFRCSYFVYNNYIDHKLENDEFVYVDKIVRTIICDVPRIRVYDILWDYGGIEFKEDLEGSKDSCDLEKNGGKIKSKKKRICKKKRKKNKSVKKKKNNLK